MSGNPETINIPLGDVKALAKAALMRAGADDLNAGAVAETIWQAERDGAAAHGLFRLPGYMASLKSGKVNGKARPRCDKIAPAVIRVEGDDGFAPLALQVLRDPLAELAREQGIAAAALVQTFHFAALWVEVEALAERNVLALACCSYKPVVTPAGGRKPVFGTNPMAFAWPRPGKAPMVFDQASSVMSRGDVQIAAREGRLLPEGVGIDPEGKPTTDPNQVLKGAMLTFGGHKGSSIALMIELLAGPLLGEVTSPEAAAADNNDGGPPRGGEFLMAIDPRRFGAESEWANRAEGLFAELTGQPNVHLPGDRRRSRRKEVAAKGVTIPQSLYSSIMA